MCHWSFLQVQLAHGLGLPTGAQRDPTHSSVQERSGLRRLDRSQEEGSRNWDEM
jgi:hypothetical protein